MYVKKRKQIINLNINIKKHVLDANLDGSDLFFHISSVQGNEPNDGDTVEYELGEGPKGPCAVNVKVSGN